MKKLYIFLFIFILFNACSKPIKDLEITSSTSLSFGKNGGSQEVKMTAYSDWISQCDASWVTLSPASGKAGSDGVPSIINVNVKPNTEYDDRTCTISITSNGKIFTVSVSQKTRTAVILDEATQTLDYKEQNITIKGKSNVRRTVVVPESCSGWISYGASKALESFDIVLHIAENDSDENDREGKVIVKGDEPGIADTLLITQGKKPSILLCEVPGIYKKRAMLAGYTEFESQTGFFRRTTGLNEFQIVNPSKRKFIIFSGLSPLDEANEDIPYEVSVSQNITTKLDPELSLSLVVRKIDNGYIWANDESGMGVIIKVK